MSNIQDRIKIVRKSKGMTQQAFAEKLGLKQNTIATYEMGKTVPSDRTISDICEKFGINETWLRNGIGEMEAETTQQQKLSRFFADVMATAPDERSAFIAALDDLPAEFWPMVVDLAKNVVANLKEKEAKVTELHLDGQKNIAAARSGDRMEAAQVSKEEEEAALPPPYTGDI